MSVNTFFSNNSGPKFRNVFLKPEKSSTSYLIQEIVFLNCIYYCDGVR